MQCWEEIPPGAWFGVFADSLSGNRNGGVTWLRKRSLKARQPGISEAVSGVNSTVMGLGGAAKSLLGQPAPLQSPARADVQFEHAPLCCQMIEEHMRGYEPAVFLAQAMHEAREGRI